MGRAERRAQDRIKKKNNSQFIQQEKRWIEHNTDLLRKVYAAVALVEHRRHGRTYTEIVNDLSEMQELWLADGTGFNILKLCAEETGINFISKVVADKLGIEGDDEI